LRRAESGTTAASCGIHALGFATAISATLLALCFALIVTRSRLPGRRAFRVLSVLPMITPPFVIGLALILLFGRSGAVNALLEHAFGITPTRWIYGLPGVWLAQTLALTPVAYLVLVGVVDGISPGFEEAAQTLRASRLRTFTSITLPLMAPGLLNAFLIVFIKPRGLRQSAARRQSSSPVRGIYFAIVGAAGPGRAARSPSCSACRCPVPDPAPTAGARSFVTISGRSEGAAAAAAAPGDGLGEPCCRGRSSPSSST
jgi:iron(III) transport system permease protein